MLLGSRTHSPRCGEYELRNSGQGVCYAAFVYIDAVRCFRWFTCWLIVRYRRASWACPIPTTKDSKQSDSNWELRGFGSAFARHIRNTVIYTETSVGHTLPYIRIRIRIRT